MNRVGILVSIATAIGLAMGWGLRGALDPQPLPIAVARPSHENSADVDASLAKLRDQLAFERDARVAFERQMEQEIARLHETLARSSSKHAASTSNAAARGGPSTQEGNRKTKVATNSFSDEALLEQGIHPEEIRTLRAASDETELQIHYLRDRAAREGWRSSNRFGQTVREIQEALRESVGDDAYDKILYATGRKNRVRLIDAFIESPATEAGIRPRDVIVSYGGERVFDPTTLYLWSTQGAMGSRTEIEVSRDGEVIRFFIPRGPLGARFEHERVAPKS
jgi:hypothetical protein